MKVYHHVITVYFGCLFVGIIIIMIIGFAILFSVHLDLEFWWVCHWERFGSLTSHKLFHIITTLIINSTLQQQHKICMNVLK